MKSTGCPEKIVPRLSDYCYLQTNANAKSNATYKLFYYTARTNTTESKSLWQFRSLNIEKKLHLKEKTKKSLPQIRRHKFYKKQSNLLHSIVLQGYQNKVSLQRKGSGIISKLHFILHFLKVESVLPLNRLSKVLNKMLEPLL